MNPLLQLAIQELPTFIQMIKDHRATENPELPPLTDDEALGILKQAIDSSEAKDDLWLSVHPVE